MSTSDTSIGRGAGSPLCSPALVGLAGTGGWVQQMVERQGRCPQLRQRVHPGAQRLWRCKDVVLAQLRGAGDRVAIAGTIRDICFIGREMEVFGQTDEGEALRIVARPDPAVIALPEGAPVRFVVARNDLSFCADIDTGARLA